MNKDFRERVVNVALTHLPMASEDLRLRAQHELNKAVQIPRYKFPDAPFKLQYRYTLEQFENKNIVAAIIINLWAEDQFDLILSLRNQALQKGFRLSNVQKWQWNLDGFIAFEELEKFNEFCDSYVQGKSKEEHDDTLLAELWLGPAYIQSLESDVANLSKIVAAPKEAKSVEITVEMPQSADAQNVASEPVESMKIDVSLSEAELEDISEDIQDVNLTDLENEIAKEIFDYSEIKKRVEGMLLRAKKSLNIEVAARPDLNLDLSFFDFETENIETKINFVQESLRHVRDYDKRKIALVEKLEKSLAEIAKLSEENKEWLPESSVERHFGVRQDYHELSSQQIKLILSETQNEILSLKSKQAQARQSRTSSVKSLASQLLDADYRLEIPIEGVSALENFVSQSFSDWEFTRIRKAEEQLAQKVQEISRRTANDIAALVEEYVATKGSPKSLINLLEGLAKEKRDTESYLLALSINTAHAGLKDLSLSRQVVESIFNGLEQFSKKNSPLVMLNYSVPFLFSGWTSKEISVNIQTCVLLLSVKYAGQFDLPSEVLWETAEWPDRNMKTWAKVWENALMDQPMEIAFYDKSNLLEKLTEARAHASQSLGKEHGSFMRLNSIKSRRHVAMLRSHILPQISDYFDETVKIDVFLSSSAAVYDKQKKLTQIENALIAKIQEEFNKDAIDEIYEHAIALDNINDIDAFHRRTSIKLITEMSEGVLSYACALLDYWREQLTEDDKIRYLDLEAELQGVSGVHNLTIQALKSWKDSRTARSPFDKDKVESALKNMITTELLSQSVYPLRFTRLIGDLVQQDLEWSILAARISEDMKLPFEKEGAASYLLEKQAPNHVLMFAQYLSLEQQKAAQEVKREKERELEKVENELMKFGGNLSDLLGDKELGRWHYVLTKTEKVLAGLKFEFESKQTKAQAQARQIRSEINTLDNGIFDSKDSIPNDAFQILKRCMDLARDATEKNEFIPSIQEFLKEIHYRFEHHSWPVEDLRDLEDKLKNLSRGDETMLRKKKFGTEELLQIFEVGDIQKIGLTIEDIAMSSVKTRADILRSWLQIKDGSGFLIEQQSAGLRLSIQTLIRYFTQMLAMKKSLDPQGRPIANEIPFTYSYWDLIYPKTAVLDETCVLVTMPGNPPSPEDIAAFQNKMEQDEWLDYYFVFLLLPGGGDKLRQRLQMSYKNKRLVVVDEAALLDNILAEQQGKNPLGVLRPLMLNRLKTQYIDVFKVSNLVDSYSSIFLGRDSQIEQIVSSASNYAIYGGRRIGKSSVMNAVEKRLIKKGTQVVSHDFQGEEDVSDSNTSLKLARKLKIEKLLVEHGDFKSALDSYLESNPQIDVVLMLDEVDKYIVENPTRHTLIETCRAMSDRHPGQFRVIIAGFMKLYDCLQGKGPYTPSSDPWQRMFNDKLLNNLSPASAEGIVKEGFLHILGWEFENRSIPLKIVELTGGHPAFVQALCRKLQERVGARNDRIVKLDDIQAVFNDKHPNESFIAFVRNTLKMNLDPIGRYLIVWLASESKDALGFTWKEILEYASLSEVPIPEKRLEKSVHRLVVTNVIREIASQVYEFSVPDYPKILNQLNDSAELKSLFDEMVESLQKNGDAHD
jgi:hypothetical protein